MDEKNRERMKETLFDAVRNQIDNGNPAETRKTYDRLIRSGYTREQSLRQIAAVLLAEMNAAMKTRNPFDEARYVKALQALPVKGARHERKT